jgi:hypothetical protein
VPVVIVLMVTIVLTVMIRPVIAVEVVLTPRNYAEYSDLTH